MVVMSGVTTVPKGSHISHASAVVTTLWLLLLLLLVWENHWHRGRTGGARADEREGTAVVGLTRFVERQGSVHHCGCHVCNHLYARDVETVWRRPCLSLPHNGHEGVVDAEEEGRDVSKATCLSQRARHDSVRMIRQCSRGGVPTLFETNTVYGNDTDAERTRAGAAAAAENYTE